MQIVFSIRVTESAPALEFDAANPASSIIRGEMKGGAWGRIHEACLSLLLSASAEISQYCQNKTNYPLTKTFHFR